MHSVHRTLSARLETKLRRRLLAFYALIVVMDGDEHTTNAMHMHLIPCVFHFPTATTSSLHLFISLHFDFIVLMILICFSLNMNLNRTHRCHEESLLFQVNNHNRFSTQFRKPWKFSENMTKKKKSSLIDWTMRTYVGLQPVTQSCTSRKSNTIGTVVVANHEERST